MIVITRYKHEIGMLQIYFKIHILLETIPLLTAAEKENEAKEAAPKFINRTANTISFNISRIPPQGNNSPMTTPTCSPVSSPVNSPVTAGTKAPYSSPNKSPTVTEVQTKKVRYCQWNFLGIIQMHA